MDEAQKRIFAEPGKATIASFDDLKHVIGTMNGRPEAEKFTSDIHVIGKFSREFGSAMANVSKARSQTVLFQAGAYGSAFAAPFTGGLSLIAGALAFGRGLALSSSVSESYLGAECSRLHKQGYRIITNSPELVLLKIK